MADVRQYAGGGPEMSQAEHIEQQSIRIAQQTAQDPRYAPRETREMNAQRDKDVQTLISRLGPAAGHDVAQMARSPDKMFARSEVLTSLKAIMASKGGITEAITAFENLE